MNIGYVSCPSLAGLGARGRRVALQVHGAKKGSSPWSSSGPKRGGGGGKGSGGDAGNGNGNGSSKGGGTGGTSKPKSGSAGSSPWSDTTARRGAPGPKPLGGAVGSGLGSSAVGRAAAARRAAAPPEVTMTDPIRVTLLDELTPSEPAAEPKWGTFCSHLNGEWVGQYAAYTPWEGKPEPAWVDERGRYINVVYTRALEHRHKYAAAQRRPAAAEQEQGRNPGGGAAAAAEVAEAEGEVDVLLRKIGRSTSLAGLSSMRLPPEGALPGDPESADSDGVDVEALAFNSDGIVVFDGGNYSAGPEYIGQQQVKLVDELAIEGGDEEGGASGGEDGTAGAADRAASGAAASTAGRSTDRDLYDEDEDEEEEYGEDEDGPALTPSTTTSVFEQCLTDWGSGTRMRLKLTLRIGQLPSGEVDVEVLRILLFSEQWLGPATSETLSTQPEGIKVLQWPCTDLPRPTPTQLQGSWNVFTVCAAGIDEVDPLTDEERVVWVYTSGEEQQLWDTSSGAPAGEGDEGGSYWLPGGVVLSLRMLDNYVPAEELDSDSDPDSDAPDAASTSGFDAGSDSAGSAASGRAGASKGSNGNSGSNGNGSGSGNGSGAGAGTYPRGLCVSMGWLWREGSVSLVEREYDGYGYLREVRLAQAVKGGWSGGRM